MVEASAVLLQFLNGLSQAMLLLLIASGLSIIFGLIDVLNFAHGSFYMLGAYFGMTLYVFTGQFWIGILAAFVIMALIGALIEYVTLRPLHGRDPANYLLATFGLLLIFNESARVIWGSQVQSVAPPALLAGSVSIFGTTYPVYRLFILAFGAAFAVAVYLLITRTKLGLIVRAGTYDRELVRSFGIRLPRVFMLTFALGTGIAAVSGIIAAPLLGLEPTMGDNVIIDAFMVVIIGGLGSYRGAIIASLLIAEIRALGVLVLPRYTVVLVFLAFVVMLAIRPEGIMGDISSLGVD